MHICERMGKVVCVRKHMKFHNSILDMNWNKCFLFKVEILDVKPFVFYKMVD